MPSYENLVLGLSLIACGVGSLAAFRLYCQNLHRRYRFLFLFLCFHVVRSFGVLAIGWWWTPHPRNASAWAWVLTEPLVFLVYILMVLELYSLVLQNYKGLQTIGRWVFLIAMTLSIAISGMSVVPSWQSPNEKVPVVFYFALISRGIFFSLVIFILLILFFLSWYPISLSRNLVVHTAVCTVVLISHSMGYLVRNVNGEGVNHAVNLANLAISTLGWAAWALLLTRQGEAAKMVVRREFTADEERHLVDQLTAINSSLLRAARK